MTEKQNQTNYIEDLQAAIERAAADYDWPRVVELTTQVLGIADLLPETAQPGKKTVSQSWGKP